MERLSLRGLNGGRGGGGRLKSYESRSRMQEAGLGRAGSARMERAWLSAQVALTLSGRPVFGARRSGCGAGGRGGGERAGWIVSLGSVSGSQPGRGRARLPACLRGAWGVSVFVRVPGGPLLPLVSGEPWEPGRAAPASKREWR